MKKQALNSIMIMKSNPKRERCKEVQYIGAFVIITSLISVWCGKIEKENEKGSAHQSDNAFVSDLNLMIDKVSKGNNGFPLVTASIHNVSRKNITIIEHPNYLWVHVGTYIDYGPLGTFAESSKIINPGEKISLPQGTEIWVKNDNPVEICKYLPPGEYDLWISWKNGESRILSSKQIYINER